MAASQKIYRLVFETMNSVMVEDGETFRVLKGSHAKGYCKPCTRPNARRIQKRLIDEGYLKFIGYDYYEFTRDYNFSTISEATNVLIGSNVNGFRYWKQVDPVSLD